MAFTGSPMTQAAHAEMRAHHDLRMTGERDLVTWLAEFGYLHAANGSIVIASRVARAERGAPRLSFELAVHARRRLDRVDTRSARELSWR